MDTLDRNRASAKGGSRRRPERKRHHRIPKVQLRRRGRLEAQTELTGTAIQEWLDHEHECLRYGLLPDLSRDEFREKIEASVVEISYHEHRFRVHARQWAEWGRRGGLATLARYGHGHFRRLALRRWGKIPPGELTASGRDTLEEQGAERSSYEAA